MVEIIIRVLLVGFFRYFNFLANYDVFLIVIFYILVTRFPAHYSDVLRELYIITIMRTR
jgi:hypothetical protein